MRRARDPITRLRIAIDCLPAQTRRAMLDGIRTNPIVVGAYTDNRGGICPMLAAHRNGARTTFLSFARSWDAFSRTSRVRRASERELQILEELLEASLLSEEAAVDLGAAIAEHREVQRRRDEQFPEIRAYRLKPRDAQRAHARMERVLERL